MKKIFIYLTLACILMLMPQSKAKAQHLFGYFSYNEILQSMPEYTDTLNRLAEMKAQFDAEIKRVENDFNNKYEEFLDGQKDFPAIILQKRQIELQEMMEKNIAFKQEAKRQCANAEKVAMDSLKNKVNKAIRIIGEAHKYAFVINTDVNACPWIDPAQGVDLTTEIRKQLNH